MATFVLPIYFIRTIHIIRRTFAFLLVGGCGVGSKVLEIFRPPSHGEAFLAELLGVMQSVFFDDQSFFGCDGIIEH
jgi:hypothetical protein